MEGCKECVFFDSYKSRCKHPKMNCALMDEEIIAGCGYFDYKEN